MFLTIKIPANLKVIKGQRVMPQVSYATVLDKGLILFIATISTILSLVM